MDTEEKKKETTNKKRILTLLKFALLVAIVFLIPLYIILFHKDVISGFESYEDIVRYLRSFGIWSIFVYLIMQTLQILISVLPGQVFQIAAGSIFGFLPGLLFSALGAAIGETVTYYLAIFLGEDAMHLIFGEEKMQHYVERLNSERAYVITFLIFLIPGIPKDLMCYAAGISHMRYKAFLILSVVGRIPGMCASLLFGHMYMQGNYTGMIIIGVIAVIVLILCLIFRERLHRRIDQIYQKLS